MSKTISMTNTDKNAGKNIDPRQVASVKVETVGDSSRVTLMFENGDVLWAYGSNSQARCI